MREYEYLSEEALESLILSASTDEAKAPSSIMENVLATFEENNQDNQEGKKSSKELRLVPFIEKPPKSLKERKVEFRHYCMKVIGTSVAAFIVGISLMQVIPKDNPMSAKADLLTNKVMSKEEVIAEKKKSIYGEPTYYISKFLNQNHLYKLGGLNDETK